MKVAITDTCSDWTEVITMEQAEDWFRNGRFAAVMKGLDGFFVGTIVYPDTPLGYVEEIGSLVWEGTESNFTEYAEPECNIDDRYGTAIGRGIL